MIPHKTGQALHLSIELLSRRRLLRHVSLVAAWLPLLACLLLVASRAEAQQPILSYTLTVNTNDCSAVQVTTRLRGLPPTFHLAMAPHFLVVVDDVSWVNVENLEVSRGTVTREEDGFWRVNAPGRDVEVRYKLRVGDRRFAPQVRRPFLAPTGGMIGDWHMFMYVVEAPQAAAQVTLELPPDWSIATSLAPTSDPHRFHARNAQELCDSPILVGKLREWHFRADQTPVRVAYWPLPEAKAFDGELLADDLRKLVQAAADLFGGPPWREYLFLVRDGVAEEGLEHFDCVTLGLSSQSLAASGGKLPVAAGVMVAHEFFHTWNMMRIHSAEFKWPDRRPSVMSGVWLSEGFTLFYADLLLRRAGLIPVNGPTRAQHLEELIATHLGQRQDGLCSAEKASRVFGTLVMGDRQPSVHIQGELMAVMLDLEIRDATGGQRSLDDLMRALLAHCSTGRGFTTKDVQRLASELCGRSLAPFFDAYVRGARPMDFNRYLARPGLKMEVEWKPAALPDGTLQSDRQVEAYFFDDKPLLKLWLYHPDNAWGRAGLHTGDELLRFNGAPVETEPGFAKLRDALRIGDTAHLEVRHDGKVRQATVTIGSYDWPVVKIKELPNRTERQKAIFTRWSAGQ